jgi:protein-L-isoaspartate(D-aspartate) O-methyltransferase
MPERYSIAQKRMIAHQLERRGIQDSQVLRAMASVPRHLFVEEGLQSQAYEDRPLNIGHGQTISQPYTVAAMTEALKLSGTEKVLEIGSGCGYQTAILMELVNHVYCIERIGPLANRARKNLYFIGYDRFTMRIGDGTHGWEEHAPFDAILVAAGAPIVPQPLVEQLADGGRLIVPVGNEEAQDLILIVKNGKRITEKRIAGYRFVKLIGSHGW